ncbi:MAG: DUF3426 domain-containing protein, partial [Gammaproteobacteria bacterium]
VSALPWTPPAITAPVSEFDEQDNDPPIDFTAPLEPSYETSSDESILAAQEDFFSITPEPPSADQSAISSLAPQPENEFEESNGDTVIEPDPAAMDAAPFEVLDPEPSDDEIRARALRAQFEDEGALESLPPENLSVLGKFANTLELPLGVRRNWGRNIALSLLALILGGLLAAQYLWRYQSLFAQDPLLRPLYQLACNSLGCQLPAYQDIASIVSDGLTVRSHPQRDNALVANITFQNAAPFPQPFPIMILSFNSATNSVIALREFSPDEYLPPQLQDFALMPSLTPIQLSLELIDPGPDAVNYTLAFRRP